MRRRIDTRIRISLDKEQRRSTVSRLADDSVDNQLALCPFKEHNVPNGDFLNRGRLDQHVIPILDRGKHAAPVSLKPQTVFLLKHLPAQLGERPR